MSCMIRIWMLVGVVGSCVLGSVRAELPAFYKEVAQLVWVVDDVDEIVQGWERLGFPKIKNHGELTLQQTEFRGNKVTPTIRAATGQLGDVRIHWIQPLAGE